MAVHLKNLTEFSFLSLMLYGGARTKTFRVEKCSRILKAMTFQTLHVRSHFVFLDSPSSVRNQCDSDIVYDNYTTADLTYIHIFRCS